MPLPTELLPTTGEVSMLSLVTQINDWLSALKGAWYGNSPPVNPVDGQIWVQPVGNALVPQIRLNGRWREIQHDGNSFPLGATAATARTALDVLRTQSSAYSPTANRAMMIGAFGLGGPMEPPPNNRLNNITESGFYAVTLDTQNTPENVRFGGACLALVTSSSYQVQLLLGRREAGGVRVWIRFEVDDSWEAWNTLTPS